MLHRRFEFEEVFRIIRIILRLLNIVAREFSYAVVSVPLRHGPEMAYVVFKSSPHLDAQISFDAFIIRNACIDEELKILLACSAFVRPCHIRVIEDRFIPDTGYS